ncbi:MAG: hypothetical protein KDC28_14010 [Saprospiraceae bacterium]|nr:hypothetical protein [Saprospiraceae bacterium]MCB9321840.1 hypothetical protein [Lewinellaceae bacterium]
MNYLSAKIHLAQSGNVVFTVLTHRRFYVLIDVQHDAWQVFSCVTNVTLTGLSGNYFLAKYSEIQVESH